MPKRGSRGSKDRKEYKQEIRKEASKLVPHTSPTAAHLDAGKYYECLEAKQEYDPIRMQVVETPIVDKSLTAKQYLRILPQRATETMTLRGKQLDKTLKRLVVVTDTKIIRRTDRSLLNQSKPFSTMPILKRETSISHRIKLDEDAPIVRERTPNNGTEVDFDNPAIPARKGRTKGRIL